MLAVSIYTPACVDRLHRIEHAEQVFAAKPATAIDPCMKQSTALRTQNSLTLPAQVPLIGLYMGGALAVKFFEKPADAQ